MVVSVAIFSEAHDEETDRYADYSSLIEQLPVVKYYPPEADNPNRFFQGVVVVEDLEFVRALMNRLDTQVIFMPGSPEIQVDLVMSIMDSVKP